jgi:hypothetical protein
MATGNNNTEGRKMTRLLVNAESNLNSMKPGTVRVINGFAIARFSNGTFGIGNVNGESAEALADAARKLVRLTVKSEEV